MSRLAALFTKWSQTLAGLLPSALSSEVSPPLPESDDIKAQTTEAQGQQDAQKRRRYHQVLRKRRTRTSYIKLLANILFLFAWSFVTLNGNTYKWIALLGGKFWIDFAVYTGVSAGFPLFSLIGRLRQDIIVSQVWFEAVWLLGVSLFDTFLIYRLIKYPPPFKDWTSSVFGDPYLTVSLILYILAVTGLAFDLFFSLLWSAYLSTLAWLNRASYPRIWLAHAADFPWVWPIPPPTRSLSLVQLIFGIPRKRRTQKSIPNGLKNWILESTMFRRFGPFEPLSHSITRGCAALVFWIILLTYGIVNCVVNPIRQFTASKGLPTRSLTRDSRPTGTFGHVSGFIDLDVLPYSQFETDDGSWKLPPGMCDDIGNGIGAFFTDPASGQTTTCNVNCGGLTQWKQPYTFLRVEARWDCGLIWDHIDYQTPVTTPITRPFVTVVWNSAFYNYSAKPLLTAGLLSVPATANKIDFSTVSTWGIGSPREWKYGINFNLTAGKTFQINVGRRRIYANQATFRDLIGVAQSPDIFVTYPILSINSTNSSFPKLVTMNFYPAFGVYEDEIFEEYLEYTVLKGLSTTGGLYSSFEFIFILIFGRSLVAAVFGGKHITPFGLIASRLNQESFRQNLLKKYPGIDGNDPAQRAHETCDFLHDFVLDLRPLKIPAADAVPGSDGDSGQTGNDGNVDGEVAERVTAGGSS